MRRLKPRKALSAVFADVDDFVRGPTLEYASDLSPDPQLYPLALERLLEHDPLLFSPLDGAGVPVRQDPEEGDLYIPSRIAGYALAQWNLARRTPDALAMRGFLAAADWFAGQPQARFMHHIPLEGMTIPWPSCLAQGEGVSVLVRAWMATGGRRYLEQARASLDLLETPVAAGGVVSALPDGGFFVEEYPGGRHRNVLNGALFAAIGLDDLIRFSGEPEPRAAAILDRLLASLERNMELWSVGDWSIYSLDRGGFGLGNACTLHYQLVHVALLEHLASRSPALGDVARRWRRGSRRRMARLGALGLKSAYRITAGW